MMKMHYKKIGTALAVLGILTTTSVLAQESTTIPDRNKGVEKAQMIQDKKDINQDKRMENLCERITQSAENLNQKASAQEEKVKNRQQERLTAWTEKTGEADAKLKKTREKWEANRSEQFSKLEEVADTDEQKKAVAAFEATTKSAIAVRKTATEAALTAFRAGVKAAIATRQSQVDNLVSLSSTNRISALTEAQTACEAGKDAATVRASFQSALKGARTKMQEDHQNITKVSSTVQTLIQTRKIAVEKAMSEFKATMEQSRVNLRKAFPETAETSEDASISDTTTDMTDTN